MPRRMTAAERSLPGLLTEANKRLQAVQDCIPNDWTAIEESACYLAQLLSSRPDAQPDWNTYPLGGARYDRLKLSRRGPGDPSQAAINKANKR